MKSHWLVHAAAILFAGSAHAQLVEPSSQQANLYATQQAAMQASFDKAYQPYPRAYGRDEAAVSSDKAFKGLFKRDPRLVGGYQLTPNLAIEAGYVYLMDRGFHRIDPWEPENPLGTLNINNFSSHLAAKYSLPLTDKLVAYGKVGKAHSVMTVPTSVARAIARETGQQVREREKDTGLYVGAGAQYQLDEKTTIDAQYGRHGDSAKKWGKETNSTGVRANLKMGF